MTWIGHRMGRAEGRKKETLLGSGSNRKKRKTKKEKESHLQIHNYIIQCLSSWEMDLCSLHLTFLLPSVHSSPRWRVEMSSEPGKFPKTRCGNVLFGIHEHNKRRLLPLPYKSWLPFLLSNGFCPVVLNIWTRNLMKSHSSKYLGRTTAMAPPTSLLLGWSFLGSTILNSQMLRENKKTSWNPSEETCCLRPDGFPHASAVAVPQS